MNKVLREWKRIFREAVACSIARENPFDSLRQEKVGQRPWQYVSPAACWNLIEEPPSLRWKGMIVLGYCCGLRLGEVINLTWSDVDFEMHRLRVVRKAASKQRAAWTPKDKDMRIVPLPDAAVSILAELQLSAADGQEYVFVTRRGRQQVNGRRSRICGATFRPSVRRTAFRNVRFTTFGKATARTSQTRYRCTSCRNWPGMLTSARPASTISRCVKSRSIRPVVPLMR